MNTYNSTIRQTLTDNHEKATFGARPLRWLRAGWDDMVSSPANSLALGLGFTALCFAAYSAATNFPMFSITYLTLLLAASPFLATTAYFVARQIEQGAKPSLHDSVREMRNRALSIGLFSLLSALLVAAWVRLSSIAFALYFGTLGVDQAQLARTWTAGFEMPAMLIFVGTVGIVLGLTLFAVGAVALPYMADRNDNLINAVRTSLETLRANASTMAVWMVLIVALLALALVTDLLLMPVIFPLLAYATWHSYRDLCQ
jgi:uncharacterized membrane protein